MLSLNRCTAWNWAAARRGTSRAKPSTATTIICVACDLTLASWRRPTAKSAPETASRKRVMAVPRSRRTGLMELRSSWLPTRRSCVERLGRAHIDRVVPCVFHSSRPTSRAQPHAAMAQKTAVVPSRPSAAAAPGPPGPTLDRAPGCRQVASPPALEHPPCSWRAASQAAAGSRGLRTVRGSQRWSAKALNTGDFQRSPVPIALQMKT
mmetsp:Transcript_108855/g.336202  ORF Transcript_108855/g.336202 Transcript_108855/m.336202 type:complete len:208 (+) Transcript_108855:115-738(+)